MLSTRLFLLNGIGLVLLTLAAYSSLWENGFIDLDDGPLIVQNPNVSRGLMPAGIQWAWTTWQGGNWIPLTWMSLQLDASLSNLVQGSTGSRPLLAQFFHGQNLFWHCATVVLVFVLLNRLTASVWRSGLVAALFAIHPLHVESVAWAFERKDVLSTFFGVLALLAYARYARGPTLGRYLLVVVSFVLSLLAKPMLVTLPFVLLLLDWWPLQRGKENGTHLWLLLLEKLPLLVLAAVACGVTLLAQQSAGAVLSGFYLSYPDRVVNAVASYGWYLEKTFWPTGLTIFYCHPLTDWQWQPVLISGIVVLGVTALAVGMARKAPWLLVGWLWFLGTLVPVLGLVQVGDQAHADRYAYVPHIGLFLALVWSVAALLQRVHFPVWGRAVLATACLVALSIACWVQVRNWENGLKVWNHALAVSPENHRAHHGLGHLLLAQAVQQQDGTLLAQAQQHFEQAVSLLPINPQYHADLATLFLFQGNEAGAAEQIQEVIRLDPFPNRAWHTLGKIQRRRNHYQDAEQSFARELELKPQAADTHAERGLALWLMNRPEDALQEWQTALQLEPNLDPQDPELHNGLGLVLLRQGQTAAALERITTAVQGNPNLAEAWSNQGLALGRLEQWEKACQSHQMALQLMPAQAPKSPDRRRPDRACCHCRLAWALQARGLHQAAAAEYARATEVDPGWLQANVEQAWRLATEADSAQRDATAAWELAGQVCQASNDPPAEALDALAAALAGRGRFAEAVQTAQQALTRALPGRRPAITARIALYQKGQVFVFAQP